MEESGENWPCNSDLEVCEDVIFEDGESKSVCDDDEDHYYDEDHIDKNEKDLTKRLLLKLSSTIGLKKMDDTTILEKAREYVKQLEERVRDLEQEFGSSSNIICGNKGTKVNSNDGTIYFPIPEVNAKVLQKEVMVTIHCEKQKGVMLKIFTHLENLHLSIVNSSVLQFGKSTIDITIIAKMSEGYNMTLDELVKTLRIAISTK